MGNTVDRFWIYGQRHILSSCTRGSSVTRRLIPIEAWCYDRRRSSNVSTIVRYVRELGIKRRYEFGLFKWHAKMRNSSRKILDADLLLRRYRELVRGCGYKCKLLLLLSRCQLCDPCVCRGETVGVTMGDPVKGRWLHEIGVDIVLVWIVACSANVTHCRKICMYMYILHVCLRKV